MKKFKYRPIPKSQFATLVVHPKPTVGEDGYTSEYPTVDLAIRALPKRYGGVILVRGKHRIKKSIRLPKDRPVTIIGGQYEVSRRAKSFIHVSGRRNIHHGVFDAVVNFAFRNKAAAMSFDVSK